MSLQNAGHGPTQVSTQQTRLAGMPTQAYQIPTCGSAETLRIARLAPAARQVVKVGTKVDGVRPEEVKSHTSTTSSIFANLRVPFLDINIMHIQYRAGLLGERLDTASEGCKAHSRILGQVS